MKSFLGQSIKNWKIDRRGSKGLVSTGPKCCQKPNSPTLDAESKSAKIPNSVYEWGGGGGGPTISKVNVCNQSSNLNVLFPEGRGRSGTTAFSADIL